MPPVSETEKHLVTIWAQLLKLDENDISINANFFELGGHSLLVVKLIAQIREKLNIEIMITDVFIQPYIRFLAQHIDDKKVYVSLKEHESKASIKSEGTL
jgi:acyl carrier protein